MDRSQKELPISCQCSVESDSEDSHDILWVKTKYKFDQIKIRKSKSILVVDENYLTDTLSSILENSDFHVDSVQNGIQALRMMVNKHYDVVVMEANLPGLKGGELAQITKNMSPDTKVVLMIRDEYSDTLRDVPTDVDDVLLKPFAPEELVRIAKRLLEPGEETKAEHKLRLPFA